MKRTKYKIALILRPEGINHFFLESNLNLLKKNCNLVFNPKDKLSPDIVKRIIKNADGCITAWEMIPFTKDILEEAPNLKIIAHLGGSIKTIVCPEIWKRNIAVTNCAASIGIGVAEYTLGLIICGLKRVFWMNELTHEGLWKESKEIDKVKELYGITIGIIGAGWAGSHLLKLLKNFQVRRLIYDPYLTKKKAIILGAEKISLETLLKLSDVISLHAPDLPGARNMLNSRNLPFIKDGALFINTARGTLINEMDLIKELKTGRFTACLDVTFPEPPALNNPLRKLSNVILTPHIAGAIANNKLRQGGFVTGEIMRFIKGEKLLYRIDPKIVNKIA